jgi:hypothetical protein
VNMARKRIFPRLGRGRHGGRGQTRPRFPRAAKPRTHPTRKAERSGAVGGKRRVRKARRSGGSVRRALPSCSPQLRRKRPPRFASPSGWDANRLPSASQWAVRPIF